MHVRAVENIYFVVNLMSRFFNIFKFERPIQSQRIVKLAMCEDELIIF